MKNVIIRSISGTIYIALIILATVYGGWFFSLLIAAFIMLGTLEYQKISIAVNNGTEDVENPGTPPIPWALRATDMAAALSLAALASTGNDVATTSGLAIVLVSAYLLIRLSGALAQKHGHAPADTAMSLLGLFYIALPLSMLIYFRNIMSNDSVGAILGMFILIWLNDTGAFCVGCTLGRHRLCERLSPKKSWEGFWGGFVTCLVAGALMSGWMGTGPWWLGLVYGAAVSIAATFGDLFESLLKRTAKVKDAGNIIPGHGGVLDRIDSLLFAIPVSMLFQLITLNL